MTATPDDERIEAIVRTELEEGRKYMERSGLDGTTIAMHRHPRTDAMEFEVGARYPECPDGSVFATVEIDAARLGWSLAATLHKYLDSDPSDREVRGLGGMRVEGVDQAVEAARILATAAWVAVRDYVLGGCRGEGL